MRSRHRRLAAAAIAVIASAPGVLPGASRGAAAALDAPAGLVSGRPHVVRLRPELSALAPERPLTRRERARGTALVAGCDLAGVTAAARVPTTAGRDDAAAACVVLPFAGGGVRPRRAWLAPARVTGNEIATVAPRRRRKGPDEILVRLTERGAQQLAASSPDASRLALRVDVDGEIVGTAIPESASAGQAGAPARLVVSAPRLTGDAIDAIVDAIDQARSEQLIELAGAATMTRSARELLGGATARVDDKPEFARHCPNPEPADTLILGCYDGRVFVLRVDRPDLAGVMPVTLAHEMLHVAYDGMPRGERRRVDAQLESFIRAGGDPRIQDLLDLYARFSPETRSTELHSLVGTQIRDLPSALERHYRQFFHDRAAVVDAFAAYQEVFDDLQARYAALQAEVQALEARLQGLRAEIDAAAAEAERLAVEINALRAQGRIDESNALVGPQNDAANRANSLASSFNVVVDEHNAKVAELNAQATAINDTYNSVRPIPAELPASA